MTDINKCTCPFCRFARKELTVNEIAWYLKSCIEQQEHYLNLIENAKSLDELKNAVYYDKTDLEENIYILSTLKDDTKRNPTKWWDKAMDEPENFVLEKKDESN